VAIDELEAAQAGKLARGFKLPGRNCRSEMRDGYGIQFVV
jgi:hypothetical protein